MGVNKNHIESIEQRLKVQKDQEMRWIGDNTHLIHDMIFGDKPAHLNSFVKISISTTAELQKTLNKLKEIEETKEFENQPTPA